MGFYLIQLQMGGFGRCASSTRGWPLCQGPHSLALMLPRAWQLRREPKSPVPVGALPRSSCRAPAVIPALSSGVGRADVARGRAASLAPVPYSGACECEIQFVAKS